MKPIDEIRTFGWLLVVVLLLAGVGFSAQAQEVGFTETFDNPELPGWDHTPEAQVVDGVLRIEGGGFAFHGGDWQDLEMAVSIRRSGEQEVIVIFQASGGSAYIVVLGPNFALLQRESEGELQELAAARQAAIPDSDWFRLEIVSHNGNILVFLDGRLVLEAVDPTPLIAGGVGLEVVGETTAEFDDLVVASESGTSVPQESDEDTGSAGTLPVGDLVWVRTGGPLGGLGYDVRMVPENPDHMYVTDAFAGVFISTDGGMTWFPSNQGIETVGGMTGDAVPIFCLTIDPTDSDIIWVGTQGVRGIYRSEDGGQTWERRDNGVVEYEGITFRGISVDPTDNDVVYAAAEISSWVWAGQERLGREFDMTAGVVYKSTDSGMNWSPVWRGENLARYIWIDPRNTDVLYVSTGIFDREAANSDPVAGIPGGEGVLKSTDGGQTWVNINNGLENLYVGTLFMHPQDPDILLAGAGNIQYFQGSGVYITTDGGQSWTRTLDEGGSTAVEFSTANPEIAYAGDSNAVYRSEDGGWTWQQVDGPAQGWGAPGVLAGFPIDFQVDPRDPQRIFANNYGGGNFLSEDGGASWVVASTGYTGAQVRAIAVDPEDPARVLAAARSGIFLSQDAGVHWQGLSFEPAKVLEWNAVAISPVNSDHFLAANNWMGSILQSEDGGQNWEEGEGTFFGNGLAWRAFTIAPSDSEVVYAGAAAFSTGGVFDDRMDSNGIFVSQDGGRTWVEANDSQTMSAQVASLAVHPTDPLVVYAASPNMGLFKTDDGGQNWDLLNQGLPENYWAMSVAVSPAQPERVYLGLARGGVYRSEDGGASWTQSSAGLNPEANVSSIVFDPNQPEVMYLSDREAGVFHSRDGGQTWQAVNAGLGAKAVNAVSISSDGLHLYAATEGGGVYRLDLNGEAPQGAASEESQTGISQETGTDQASQPDAVVPPEAQDAPSEGMSNLLLIIGIAVVGVISVGVVILVLVKKGR